MAEETVVDKQSKAPIICKDVENIIYLSYN